MRGAAFEGKRVCSLGCGIASHGRRCLYRFGKLPEAADVMLRFGHFRVVGCLQIRDGWVPDANLPRYFMFRVSRAQCLRLMLRLFRALDG